MPARQGAVRTGRPNAGPARRSRGRSVERRAAFTLVGPALRVDSTAGLLELAVQGGGRPGPFAGRRVQVRVGGRLRADDVDGDGRITLADVRPGDLVAVRTRVARGHARLAPELVDAARVDVLRHAGEPLRAPDVPRP